jgi:thiol-disulfide isomerase/thioredoxin
MRFPAAILIAACTLAVGCTSLASRTRERDRDRDRTPADRRPRDPDHPWWIENSDSIGKSKVKPVPDEVTRTNRDSIIAGVVVDAREGRPLKGVSFVQVRAAEEAAPASGKGLGFETDADGYFFVPGLAPGKTYILSVVREMDGRKVAGETQVKPPAGNIRLEIGDDRLSSTTPPLPPPPGMGPFERGSDPAAIRPPLPDPPTGDRGWEPGTAPPPSGGLPPPPADPPLPSGRRENIAGTPTLPPTAAIRPPPPAATGPAPTRPTEVDPPVTRAPGQRVPNFIVSDVMGSDWEFRYASGRLILVEFWSTTCVPCQRAVPAMKRLQADYGTSGLEIVAIACEPDAPFNARAREVEEVARRKELPYHVYLEREGRVTEVQRIFNVQWVPTLVLLDRNGTVLWRGGATDTDIGRVDEVIKSYLTKR